ncbi:MAG: NAD(P)/FAD-dependent oxidoreductase [Roseburia sp.]
MIRINQLKLPMKHTRKQLEQKLLQMLHVDAGRLLSYQIVKQSIDARRKGELSYVYALDVTLAKETQYLSKNRNPNIIKSVTKSYCFPSSGEETLPQPPVIVGSGPAGMFCAYELALHGYHPIVIERGSCVEERSRIVRNFWETGILSENTNVQFGEGGAGTFSDGKLNTLVKDVMGRNREVLEIFAAMGAPSEILYWNKPHIGTDILKDVVKNIRNRIIELGGTYFFEHQLTDFVVQDGRLEKLILLTGQEKKEIPANVMVLAVGHSARDTFSLLEKRGLSMEAKSFAVGMRVEHPQSMIDESQYHGNRHKNLPAASYKLTANLENGRGVYSFCMCPGGYVVNASSEEGYLAVNGMSYHARDGHNANSAIIVSVNPSDYGADGPLAGMEFQRRLERRAFEIGAGRVPQQLYGDFKRNRLSTEYGEFSSSVKGETCFANLREIFPDVISDSFIQGMERFPGYIRNFNREDAILSGVESRTSSPVRISRDERFESNISGIYPCGEGAGYAGGIMSAAMDGLKVAEAIASRYKYTEGRKL